MEMAERFIPWGGEFFARLSRYDDFLADVVQKPGYNAGDTLRLIAPFFVAFGLRDSDVQAFSAEQRPARARRRSSCWPRCRSLTLPELHHLDLVHALRPGALRGVGFPFEQCRCTELALKPGGCGARRSGCATGCSASCSGR